MLPDTGFIPFVRKHVGPAQYEPITLSFGLAMDTARSRDLRHIFW